MWRWAIFLITPAVCLVILFMLVPPTPQWRAYHVFADQRELWGIPHFADVFSNILFPIAGVVGWWALVATERSVGSRVVWSLFFLAVIGVGVGSAIYHYAPSDGTLLWDRIPIAIGTGLLFWALTVDRTGERWSWAFGVAWMLLAVAGVIWWWLSELIGKGDLRLYGFVTFYPFVGVLILWLLWVPRFQRQGWVMAALVLYALSRITELYDAAIFTMSGQLTSGHTLKHVVAAAAIFCVVASLWGRKLVNQSKR